MGQIFLANSSNWLIWKLRGDIFLSSPLLKQCSFWHHFLKHVKLFTYLYTTICCKSRSRNRNPHSIYSRQRSPALDIFEGAPCRIVHYGIPYQTPLGYCLAAGKPQNNAPLRFHKPLGSCYFWTPLHPGNPGLSLDIWNTLMVRLIENQRKNIILNYLIRLLAEYARPLDKIENVVFWSN